MKNNIQILIIFLFACVILLFFHTIIIAQISNADGIINVLSSEQNNLTIELNIPPFERNSKSIQGQKYDILNIPEFNQSCLPGKPQLPVKGYLFGLPINSTTSFEIIDTKFRTLSNFDIFITPKIINNPDSLSIKYNKPSVKFESLKYNRFSATNLFYPEEIIQLSDSAFIREQRVGRLTIFPIQYNPVTKQIRYYEKLKIKINFVSSVELQKSSISDIHFPKPFEKLLSTSLLNYELSKSFRQKVTQSQKKIFKSSNEFNINEGEWYKIIVDKDGIYKIDKTDLENAGLDISQIDPQKIKIFYQGQEIAIFVSGQDDGVFHSYDHIEFYGTAPRSEYTYNNVYWLTVASNNGLRMYEKNGALNGTPTIVTRAVTKKHFEQNVYYGTSIPDGEGEDHWFWNYVTAPNYIDLTVTLDNVVPISLLPCKLTIEYRGITHTATNPDHHTVVFINGHSVLDDKWDGQMKYQNDANFTHQYLNNGNNTIRINLPGDTGSNVDYVYLNWIEIEFWQDYSANNDTYTFMGSQDPITHQFEVKNFTTSNVFLYDITDPTYVKRITNYPVDYLNGNYTLKFQDEDNNRRYFATSSAKVNKPKNIIKDNTSLLLSENNQADYIFITFENFYNTLASLTSYRENQGLSVKTVKIQDVYDEFSYGVKNPKAIKDFLSHAYYNWRKPSPTYVLLIGDASFDYKDYLGTGNLDLVPTHLFESSVYNTETSADNWFACVSGTDVLPDILLGRLAVRTTSQLNIIINKIINYETNPVGGNWNKNVAFVSDNADGGGNFEALSDHFITTDIPSDFTASKIYLRDYGSATATKNAIINQINNGCFLVNYMGHGSLETWAHETIFKSDYISQLNNYQKLPLLVTMSCLNGFFHHADIPYCLSEEFLNRKNGGAIACLSPSGFGYTIGDQYLGDGLFKALFQENDNIVGSAVVKAKLSLFTAGSSFSDHISFFNLLGDPALQLYISPKGIPVKTEWNLISLPRQPNNKSVQSVLSSLNNGWKKLLAYSNGAWIGADSDIPSTFWTLSEMEWGRGYWLKSIANGDIVVNGSEKSSTLVLEKGWNLIGNPIPLSFKISDALSSVNGNWKKILYYSNGSWLGADATLPNNFWTLNEITPGAGYWLEMSDNDTLDMSRIPTQKNNNILRIANSNYKIIQSDDKNQNASPFLSKNNNSGNYKLSVPKPSGYYGTVTLKNNPAPAGTIISAWINGTKILPEKIIHVPGKYNLMLINGDDPNTPALEGGTKGDQIIFRIQTPDGQVFVSDTKGSWEEEINHRLDLSALSDKKINSNPYWIQFNVNDQIVGQDIFDGDPISNKATISAVISGGDSSLSNDNFKLFINSLLIEHTSYSFIPETESSEIRGKLIYLPSQLTDGEYNLRIEVFEAGTEANKIRENFSFIISSKLKLEKVVNFPNPMQGDTKFTYYLLNNNIVEVTIKIYTVAGRLIKIIQSASNQIGYNETYWDGRDEFGDKIANGVYFYKIIAKDESQKIELIERLVVMR